MQIPHGTCILIADGSKMLLLSNKGQAARPDLQPERKETLDNPKDAEQKTDAAGRASSTQSGPGAPPIAQGGSMHARGQGAQFAPSRGSMDEPDYHQLAEDAFAARMADMLNAGALSGAYAHLLVVAPARMLGTLRKHYHKEAEARLIGEIDKNLTNHPVPRIAEALLAV